MLALKNELIDARNTGHIFVSVYKSERNFNYQTQIFNSHNVRAD